LKKRLKQHLVEVTATTSGTKNAVTLNLERLTNVGYIVTTELEWPKDVDLPPRKPNEKEGKYQGRLNKSIAEAVEEMCKNDQRYVPVFHDRSLPKATAMRLTKSPTFKREAKKLLNRGFTEIALPTMNGLTKRVIELEKENALLKEKVAKLERNMH